MSAWWIATAQVNTDGVAQITAERELSDDEYERLVSALIARRKILDRTAWHVVQSNFASFGFLEEQLMSHDSGATLNLRRDPDAIQVAVTTSVVNFLLAMRMYLDHSETELKRLDQYGGTTKFPSWKGVCSAEYDDYFAYRFLCRFRNYVQHVGLPINAWNLSTSLTHSDEVMAQALAGEPLSDIDTDTASTTTRIFLSESPADLIERFRNGWSTVKEDLESLTSEIDLSEQIHICMECLTRVEHAYRDAFQEELSQCVSAFAEIVGDLQDYTNPPLLLRWAQEGPRVTAEMMDLGIERFLEARFEQNCDG